MKSANNRRTFIRNASLAGIGMGLASKAGAWITGDDQIYSGIHQRYKSDGKRVGIIGLDTSHSTAFVQALNKESADASLRGYKVVAAYAQGSRDIESSVKRVPEYTAEVKKHGVSIVNSIDDLLAKTDVILLETNDGRPHLEQVIPVFKAGKKVFIDKPVAGTLTDAIIIYDLAKKYNVPVFSSSSLRYVESAQDIAAGKTIGKVFGADTFSPCTLEKTHPDLFWYGIHGVESLFTVMGTGCDEVVRMHTADFDVVTGKWKDGRIGTFRGIRKGNAGYGGTAFGEKGSAVIGTYSGYGPLLNQIAAFFETGTAPVSPEETLEIYAFMEAADESKRKGGVPVKLADVMRKARSGKPSVKV